MPKHLLESTGIELIAERLPCGKPEMDALDFDGHGVVVVELKIDMDPGALGQLITYCHAVSKTMREMGHSMPVRGMLVSTFVDLNLVEILAQLVAAGSEGVRVDANGAPKLVDPSKAPAAQCWDQCGPLASRQRL